MRTLRVPRRAAHAGTSDDVNDSKYDSGRQRRLDGGMIDGLSAKYCVTFRTPTCVGCVTFGQESRGLNFSPPNDILELLVTAYEVSGHVLRYLNANPTEGEDDRR